MPKENNVKKAMEQNSFIGQNNGEHWRAVVTTFLKVQRKKVICQRIQNSEKVNKFQC